MPVYSPSQAKLFNQCPREWYYRYIQRKRAPYTTRGDYAMALGSAFGKAVEEYHRFGGQVGEVQMIAESSYWRSCKELDDMGLDDHAEDRRHAYRDLIDDCIGVYMQDPLKYPKVWMEQQLLSTSRLDMVMETETGMSFLDFKLKTSLRPSGMEWVAKCFAYDWQMLHYAWEMREFYGRDFNRRFCIGMMAASPTPTFKVFNYTILDEQIDEWYVTASRVWRKIELLRYWHANGLGIKSRCGMTGQHIRGYGACDYVDACFHGGENNLVTIQRNNLVTVQWKDQSNELQVSQAHEENR